MNDKDAAFKVVQTGSSATWQEIRTEANEARVPVSMVAYRLASEYGWRTTHLGMEERD